MQILTEPMDDYLWQGFQGAQSFKNGDRPWVASLPYVMVCAALESVEVHVEGPDAEPECWAFYPALTGCFTSAMGRVIAEAVATAVERDGYVSAVEAFGFEQVF